MRWGWGWIVMKTTAHVFNKKVIHIENSVKHADSDSVNTASLPEILRVESPQVIFRFLNP